MAEYYLQAFEKNLMMSDELKSKFKARWNPTQKMWWCSSAKKQKEANEYITKCLECDAFVRKNSFNEYYDHYLNREFVKRFPDAVMTHFYKTTKVAVEQEIDGYKHTTYKTIQLKLMQVPRIYFAQHNLTDDEETQKWYAALVEEANRLAMERIEREESEKKLKNEQVRKEEEKRKEAERQRKDAIAADVKLKTGVDLMEAITLKNKMCAAFNGGYRGNDDFRKYESMFSELFSKLKANNLMIEAIYNLTDMNVNRKDRDNPNFVSDDTFFKLINPEFSGKYTDSYLRKV